MAVSANTQDLQWHRSLAQKWFLELVHKTMAAQLSTRSGSKLSGQRPGSAELDLNRQMTQSNDPQGMYIVGADGTPYGFTNDHEPADISRLMDDGLKRFRTHPPRPVTVSATEKAAAFSITPPPTAQVLQVFARIPAPHQRGGESKNTAFWALSQACDCLLFIGVNPAEISPNPVVQNRAGARRRRNPGKNL